MDFIKAMLKSKGKDTTLVVVAQLTKYAYFHFSNSSLLNIGGKRAFLDTVYKLHRMLQGIISNRYIIFTSQV